MAATVKDLTDTLKGSISRELLAREGRRYKGNPTIPNDTKEGDPGTSSGAALTPDNESNEYVKKGIEQARRGGYIDGLEDQ